MSPSLGSPFTISPYHISFREFGVFHAGYFRTRSDLETGKATAESTPAKSQHQRTRTHPAQLPLLEQRMRPHPRPL